MPEDKDISREPENPPQPESYDSLTGEPASHLMGAGAGALGGGAAGAAIGTAMGGPVGTVIGAVVGAVAGAYGGKAAAQAIDPAAEDAHWRQNYQSEPYVKKEHPFEDYQPAYRTGYENFGKHEPGTPFEQAEPKLREEYQTQEPPLSWEEARPATEAAWKRAERGEAVIRQPGAEGTATPGEVRSEGLDAESGEKIESGETIRVPISEEQVKVGKREVEAGGIRIRKEVTTEIVNQPVELKREEIKVERTATAGEGNVPADAFQEGELYVPLKAEEPVVEKTTRQVGEVKVSKKAEIETENIHEQVRHEDVHVDEEDEDRRRRQA